MCWCWSEHPYHRPNFKEVLSALTNGCTTWLASAFPIANYNPIVVAACTKCILKGQHNYSLSSSLTRQHSTGKPGYFFPFRNCKLPRQVVSLDVWCACQDGLKCISCQPYNCTTMVRMDFAIISFVTFSQCLKATSMLMEYLYALIYLY